MEQNPLIVILTDFGTQDPYVGIMKGVIANITPSTRLIDLNNEIPPGDVERAGVQLWQASGFFPPGSIFLCVVDPGVGTNRKGIVANNARNYFIGPDNGLFTFIFGQNKKIYELTDPAFQIRDPSSTFHGRDIFAPAAAHLASGVGPESFGEQIFDPITLPIPLLQSSSKIDNISIDSSEVQVVEHKILGEILFSDRFGNLLTSLGQVTKQGNKYGLSPWIGDPNIETPQFTNANSHLVMEDGRILAWADTFADIPPGECSVLIGSSGLIEIAANGASAEELLGIKGREKVALRIRSKL